MQLFGDKTIRNGVMAIVEERIAQAQTEYESTCETVDVECNDKLAKVEEERVAKKEATAKKLINDILGKVL